MSSIAVDLTDDVKSRSASSAAAKLEHLSGATMVHELEYGQPGHQRGTCSPSCPTRRASAPLPPRPRMSRASGESNGHV